MKVEPIEKSTRVQLIIQRIKELIISDKLLPGDRLPAEPVLAQMLGTSRTPIREASKILEALGVLEIRRGDGTYICDRIKPSAIHPLIFHLILRRGTPQELWELRFFFEKMSVELAAEKRREEDMEILKQNLRKMEDLIKADRHDPGQLLLADLEFHDAILTATHNDLVYEIGKVILDLFKPSIAFGHEDQNISLLAFKTHKKVYGCIEKKDLLNINATVSESLAHWKPDIPQEYRSTINERN